MYSVTEDKFVRLRDSEQMEEIFWVHVSRFQAVFVTISCIPSCTAYIYVIEFVSVEWICKVVLLINFPEVSDIIAIVVCFIQGGSFSLDTYAWSVI